MELIIVGYGNMAKAILSGILKQTKEKLHIDSIAIVGRAPHKIESWLHNFLQEHKSAFCNDVHIAKQYDIQCENKNVVLACKPDNIKEFSFHGHANVMYSVLAGVDISTLRLHIHANHYVVIMPNVGAKYALSSSAVLWESNMTTAQTIKEAGKILDSMVDGSFKETNEIHHNETKEKIQSFISSFGNCVFVETQKELNASIATNGSSPAILALVAQALINAGVHQGLKLDTSKKLVQKTFDGIAELLKHETPQTIQDSIASPGGTTIEALLHCDETGVKGNIMRACIKAAQKASTK